MNPNESATDRELDQFYGVPPTESAVQESIRRFTEAFDAYDLQEIVFTNHNAISASLQSGDYAEVGRVMDVCRKAEIANLVSRELYGRRGVITAKDIK